MTTLRVATRGSALALWQARHVASLLRAAHSGLEVTEVIVETAGDRNREIPIAAIGGRGVFTKEVQAAVLDGRADLAVHSAKDLPSSAELQPEGLVLAAVPERADPRDALVGATLDAIPPGGTVGTGSVRRRAQLADRRPDLTFADLRGNIDTRLAKAPDFAAIVVAYAALQRLGRTDAVAEVLEPTVMLPQVAQGALAIESRPETAALLAAIEHAPTRRCVDAERSWLATLGGGCDLPAGAFCTVNEDGALRLRAVLATFDGRIVLRDENDGDGVALAERMLANGGAHLLEA
ncbi:MAG TPA: hydroxymethylbilane synthase [Acidimicrobiales bacterium]|nr:hydroxymethylbilane synthase [Acidimicrobiales bacterium]